MSPLFRTEPISAEVSSWTGVCGGGACIEGKGLGEPWTRAEARDADGRHWC
jgi:hypothetical protein